MTYCLGMMVADGLAMIADTRTNAGVDNISTYRKLHVIEQPGERVICVATAGNLSVTQTALAMVASGLMLPDGTGPETLETAPSLFRCAQLIGHAVSQVRKEIAPQLQAEKLAASATLLLGGQIKGGALALYMIYGQGNFIECGPDTPFLQIGEFKYGKPILDRSLAADTPIDEALKLGLLSFEATLRSNLAVGMPLDIVTLPRDRLALDVNRRIHDSDPYFRTLAADWHRALETAHHAIPNPDWFGEDSVAAS